MSNAYLNNILFGNSSANITSEYVENLIPYMCTENWMGFSRVVVPMKLDDFLQQPNAISNKIEDSLVPNVPTGAEGGIRNGMLLAEPSLASNPISGTSEESRRKNDLISPQKCLNRGSNKNTLFWSIYEHECPGEAFLNPYSANVEIDTRIKVVDKLKKTPKILKETNSKLTIEATQGLFGSMLTAREDKLEFCVAYSAFYNKHILVVYNQTYRLFSPTVSAEIEDDDHVIILYASKGRGTVVYTAEQNTTKEMADNLMREKTAELKAQSHYKIPELEAIAEKWLIPTRTIGNKRRKKEDVYNDIRLAIHNDMNFVEN